MRRATLRAGGMSLLVTALVASAVGGAATSPATSPRPVVQQITWGIGDQHIGFLNDPRWKQLPLRHVRYFVPWDLAREPRYLRLADQWLAKAHSHHTIPLVALTQSDLHGLTRVLPSYHEYRQQVGWIMRRFHWVREWSPWNEANLLNQATLNNPGRAVVYWKTMRNLCPTCTITSPSLVGYAHAPAGWMTRFLRAATGLHGPWAVHVYNDINEFHTYALTRFIHQLHGPIWVTEAAGWKHFNSFPTNQARQTRAIAFMFKIALGAFPKVARWYLYQWEGSPRGFRWDSGLLNPNGSARPALRVVQRNLLGSAHAGIRALPAQP